MVLDSLSQEIKPGDFIAYAVRSGNYGALHHGVVQIIDEVQDSWSRRVVPRVRIMRLTKDWRPDSPWKIGAKTALREFDRIVVLPFPLTNEPLARLVQELQPKGGD